MSQIIDSLPTEYSDRILCGYVNPTSQIQVTRITNISHWHFERVVFPGEHLLFESVPDAQLEIHTSRHASTILADKIQCVRLQVNQGMN